MTLARAIQIASTWAQGHVCSLRPGEAEEYHKMALEALVEQKNMKEGGKQNG